MNRLADLEFTAAERAEVGKKIRAAVENNSLDGIIAVDAGNFTYLSRGTVLPYNGQGITLPSLVCAGSSDADDFIVCPPEMTGVLSDQQWPGKTGVYSINDAVPPLGLVGKTAEFLKGKKKIGFDPEMIPADLFAKLRETMPDVSFVDAGATLKNLREVKTPGEIRMIEVACRLAERGLISALNHAEGNVHDPLNYYLWEFGERIRVHVGEFGGSMTGHLSVQQGAKAGRLFAKPELHEPFRSGSFLRAEWTSQNYGYWADSCRTIFIGAPGPEALQAYRDNAALKEAAVAALKPGVSAADVFTAVATASDTLGIPFRAESGIGHGVGTAEMEGPYLDDTDHTVLEAGMVLAVGVYTYGPAGELICSRDTYEITGSGNRLLSWYKSYDHLYSMYGSSARHG